MKKTKHLQLVIMLLLFWQITACSSSSSNASVINVKDVNYQHTTYGYASIKIQHGDSHKQKVKNAKVASKLDAIQELTAYLQGVLIYSMSELEYTYLKSELINSQTQGILKGARVSNAYYNGDIYVTELKLNMPPSVDFWKRKLSPKKRVPTFNENEIYY